MSTVKKPTWRIDGIVMDASLSLLRKYFSQRRCSFDVIHDLTQETLIAANKHFDPIRGPLHRFLLTIAHRKWNDYLRHLYRNNLRYLSSDVLDFRPAAMADTDFNFDEIEMLRDAMKSLSPAEFHVLVLRSFEGWSYSRIAARTGETPVNLRKIHSRARGKLYKLLISLS